jgi:putative ABC transport system permease protein
MPEWKSEIRARLAALRLDPTRETEIVEELSQHLDDRYADLRGRGLDDAAARATALEELSERGMLERELRAVTQRGAPSLALGGGSRRRPLEALWLDTRYSLRTFRSHPTFALVAILTFALGIGACTLIFSAVQGVIRRPLPYTNPEQLVAFWGSAPEKGLPEVSAPLGLYSQYREHMRTMSALAAYSGGGMTLTGVGDPERIDGAIVSLDFFRVFNERMLHGRPFVPGEDVRNAPPVVVLSHSLWQRKFAGDTSIVGRAIQLNSRPTTVVGVMPPGFDFPNRSELWMPVVVDPTDFNCWCYDMIGRMRPGIRPPDVAREMASIIDDFADRRHDVFPDHKRGTAKIIAMPLSDRIVGDLRRPLFVLFGAVGLVLLIACANIANLVLVRATSRHQEIAVRCCLGAGPRRIAAQLLTESVLLSVAGAVAGLLLAFWGVRLLRQLPVQLFPRMNEIRLDPVVLAFTAGVAVVTGLLCGVAPALRVSRVDLQDAIKSGSRGSSTGQTRRLSDAFVVTQFALSLILLVAAGLLLQSYRHLSTLDLGYRPDDVLVGRISLPYPKYDTSTAVRAFYEPLLSRVRALPGVTDAGLASLVPLSRGNAQNNIVAEGKEPRPGEPVLVANVRIVTPGYFKAIGTPILEGRDFQQSDDERGLRVGVADETFAKHFWPKESAIGKRFRSGGDTSAGRWVTIVGVVRNVKHNSLDEQTDLQVYEVFARQTTWSNYLVVRTAASPEALTSRLREEIKAGDPTLPFYDVHTMQSAVRSSLAIRRLLNVLLGGFALTALILAAIGIYGVIALSVTARVREFGIRLALGAQTSDVRRLVLRHGVMLAALGVTLGIAGALYLTRFIQRLLFGVTPVDWATFSAVAAILAATALLASYLPAHRATRADPVSALRSE